MTVRPATPGDAALILDLLRDLAAFEGGGVTARAQDLAEALKDGHLHALLAFDADDAVGVLTILPGFSSWRGQRIATLHDLYVRASHRRLGLGRALVGALVSMAADRGWARIDVNVLAWNTDAHAFYAGFGFRPVTGWQMLRRDGEALENAEKVQ